ncbi:MAG TPA: PAS domain-containing protein [Myxococcota bacterium]|nr:PAS domain-containing protein [Myxococcota bacterium]
MATRSLMDFVDTPVLVGDPDGRAVYVNPCFERAFSQTKEAATGVPLASLFGGGAREAMLGAVARVCGGEPRARFRLREAGTGYLALASPVVVEGGRVGVIIVLTEETRGEESLLALRRDVIEPLDEIAGCLSALAEAARGEREKLHAATGMRALARMRKWIDQVGRELGVAETR